MRSESSNWKNDEDTLNQQLAILAAAVRVEKYGREFYLKMAECIKDKEGKIILKSLADDESQHRVWLERQIDRIFPGKDVSTIAPDPAYASVVPQKVFPSPEKGCLPLNDEIKGVEAAIDIEKASAKMYDEVAGLTKDLELKNVMQHLSRWEKGHQKILEDNLHYLKRGGSWYGYTPILDG